MTNPTPLSPEDLAFWYADQPRQRTTTALLMLLDRRPDPDHLRAAVARAVDAVPRLRQRVVGAPLGLAVPRWEDDPTFDLDFHVRRYALADASHDEDELERLFHTLGPIYERPFERTRPLWELIEIDRPGGASAVFFKLHHAVADGVGGNTILAHLTDATRAPTPVALAPERGPGGWIDPSLPSQVADALRRRLGEDAERAARVGGALLHAARHPSVWVRVAELFADFAREIRAGAPTPLQSFGRARRLGGLVLPFAPLRQAREVLGVRTIDLLLAAVARAMGRWYESQGLGEVRELRTLVPINLRLRSDQGLSAGLGNRATAVLLRLPVRLPARGGAAQHVREIHRRMEKAKARSVPGAAPVIAGVMTALPRPIYRALSAGVSGTVDLVVTNVPGVPVARYLAGAEIVDAYPFAPVAPRSPLSVALYGYREQLYVGLDADGTLLPEPAVVTDLLYASFAELEEAAREEAPRRSVRAARRRSKSSSA